MSAAPPLPAPEHDAAAMTFREHLIELRQRLVRAALAIIVGFFVAWNFHVDLYAFISAPVREALANHNLFAIKAMAITESVEVYMKLSLVGGLFLASPVVFWQLWAFVAPGLLHAEKKLMLPVLTGSVACFFLGGAFCYLAVLPFMTDFLVALTVDAPGLTLEPTLASTVSFSMLMLVAFGGVFELPLVLYVLAAMQLVTAQGLLKFWRYWIVISFIIGAVLTPTPDPINQTLMSAPLVLLYGVGVGLAWITQRKPGETLSRRTAVLVAAVLTVLATAGVSLAMRRTEAPATAHLPATALQVLGVHTSALTPLSGQSLTAQEAGNTARMADVVAPLRAFAALRAEVRDPVLYVVRLAEGAVVVADVADAPALVVAASKRAEASATEAPSGKTVLLGVPGSVPPRRLRLTAASAHILWLGDDTAVEQLAYLRQGQLAGLTADDVLAGKLDALRTAGPVWSLTAEAAGLAGWLPGGAFRDQVRAASANLDRDQTKLTLHYDCKGPEAAAALRDRLDSWASDHRGSGATDAGSPAVTQRLAELAGLVATMAETQARHLPAGSQDARALQRAASEASVAARTLREALRLGAPAPVASVAPADAALLAAVAAATSMQLEVHQTSVIWTLQAPLGVLVPLLGAPGSSQDTALHEFLRALQGQPKVAAEQGQAGAAVEAPRAATATALPAAATRGAR